MKKTIFTTLLAATGLSAMAQVAHWDFNGNTNDQTLNGLNGIATNCTYVAGSTGVPGTAIKFNGFSSTVDVPFHNLTNTPRFTISAVVRLDDFNTGLCEGNAILMQESPSGNFRKSLLVSDNMYNTCGVFNASDMRFQSNTHGTNPNPPSTGQYTPGINPGQWYCVTTTYDGDTLKLYVDGVLKVANPVPNQYMPGRAPISIGYFAAGLAAGYPYYLNGAIDDIVLYNFAVPEAEIPQLCRQFVAPRCFVEDITFCGRTSSPFAYTFTPSVMPSTAPVRWNFGDGSPVVTSAGSTPVAHTFPGSGGTYTICADVLDAQGRPCASYCFDMCQDRGVGARPAAGDNTPAELNKIALPEPYPNPAGSMLNVPVDGKKDGHIDLSVYSLEGKLIHTQKVTSNESTVVQLSTELLAPGTYMLEINDGNGRRIKQFVKL